MPHETSFTEYVIKLAAAAQTKLGEKKFSATLNTDTQGFPQLIKLIDSIMSIGSKQWIKGNLLNSI